MKQNYKPGDIIGVHVQSSWLNITKGKQYEVIAVYDDEWGGDVIILDDKGVRTCFCFAYVYMIAEKKTETTDNANHPSGGLSDHYLADVKKPQRGGSSYQAECDDIIFALNMTFDEGEAFKAIWRTCTSRLGYGKKGNTALYNAQKLVHRSQRILQRAELTGRRMMAEFHVGQKVLVTGSTLLPCDTTLGMVGTICEIKSERNWEGKTAIWNSEKSDWGYFNDDDFKPITETPEPPETLTINGVEYVRKSEPAHEWKFGDVAVHKKYGVGIVVGIGDEFEFHYDNGYEYTYVSPSALTFLRRTDFSV